MKKIVHYIPGLVNGGIESMLLNYYEKIKDKYQFIIIVHGNIEKSCEKKFLALGSTIYKIPHWNENLMKHNSELYKILKKERPQIFHTHHGIYNFIPSIVARVAKIKIIISHCHSYFPKKSFKEKIYSILSKIFSTNSAACGIKAAEYLNSNNNVKVIYNAIPLDKYKYSESFRKKIREKHSFSNFKVYGNIGRYAEQKNQLFLIDIFEKIYQYDNESRFIIIGGDGPLYEKVKAKVDSSIIKDKCILLKDIKNVNEYYSALDILLLSSLFEGFAVTVIEAQASSLPCVLSPTITDEMKSDNIYFASSIDSVDEWLKVIKKVKFKDRNKMTTNMEKFDINYLYKDLLNYYDNLIKEKNL